MGPVDQKNSNHPFFHFLSSLTPVRPRTALKEQNFGEAYAISTADSIKICENFNYQF